MNKNMIESIKRRLETLRDRTDNEAAADALDAAIASLNEVIEAVEE